MKDRIIIAGSRNITDYEAVKKMLDIAITETPNCIISGGAKGVDSLAIRYADEKNYNLEVYKPDWDLHGKSAGIIRNKLMATKGTWLIAFWDGQSRGTKNMIEEANKNRLRVTTIYFN